MGKQIQIAQSPEDEQQAIAFLQKKVNWLSLPRLFQTARPKPMPLGLLRDTEQIIFPEEFASYILKHIQKRLPSESRSEKAADVKDYLVYPNAYACIEWTRSVARSKAISKGRYYLATSGNVKVTSTQKSMLMRAMNGLVAYIRRTAPVRVDYTSPIYVGENLWRKLKAGKLKAAGDLAGSMVPNNSR